MIAALLFLRFGFELPPGVAGDLLSALFADFLLTAGGTSVWIGGGGGGGDDAAGVPFLDACWELSAGCIVGIASVGGASASLVFVERRKLPGSPTNGISFMYSLP